jgi:uroporphyrinogen-III synthase
MTAGRVWVTRTQPQADATAGRLTALGFTPLVVPVLEARARANAVIDLVGVQALAFTSGHAIAAFAALSADRALPVFAVGDATAEAARAAGFAAVRSAGGDVAALADLIAGAQPGLVLAPGAASPAADLAALLAARGVSAAAVPVYETVPTGAAPALGQIDAVLVHSPRGAQLVAAHLAGRPEAADLAVHAISAAAAAPLADLPLKSLAVATHPSEGALLATLKP